MIFALLFGCVFVCIGGISLMYSSQKLGDNVIRSEAVSLGTTGCKNHHNKCPYKYEYHYNNIRYVGESHATAFLNESGLKRTIYINADAPQKAILRVDLAFDMIWILVGVFIWVWCGYWLYKDIRKQGKVRESKQVIP